MLVVPALKIQQFSKDLYLLNLAAGDVERLVRFEVLGAAALQGKGTAKGKAPLVNWAELEGKVQASDEAYQRPIIKKKIEELAAHYMQCREDGEVPAVPGAVLLTTDEEVVFTPQEGNPFVGPARLVAAALEGHDETDVLLVTGRMRPIDRDRVVRSILLPRAGASRSRGEQDRPLVVVAPQCIEAGADLDFDALVTECASSVSVVENCSPGDLAAAFFSDMVQDNNGKTRPTALHFMAGQQAFPHMVNELRAGIRETDVQEALVGPWQNKSALPSLSWDASVSRSYALRASNPSKEKRGSVPAANWLGLLGLSFFPVHVRRDHLGTTCVRGGWKDSVFTWPLWNAPVTASTAPALLRAPGSWSARERTAMGISLVLSCRILRSDQGGYGSFCPAEVVLPGSS